MKSYISGMLALLLVCVSAGQVEARTRVTYTVVATTLVDSSNMVHGAAGFERLTRNTTSNSYLEVVLFNLTQAAGTQVNVTINGAPIGTATVKAGRGSHNYASLVLSTRRGDTVPTVAAGDSITIQDSTGATLFSGQFQAF